MKLYPPVIEGTIPAFSGTELTVPFAMNKTVGQIQVHGFALKIKTVQSNRYLVSISTQDLQGCKIQYSFEPYTSVTFKFSDEIMKKFNRGQYYKIQLAYINGEDVGYYSTVGIIKYTYKPDVFINGLSEKEVNMHQYKYTGVYSQLEKDVTEKVYSYQFDIYDINNNLVKTSGNLLHNTTYDTEIYESTDSWTCEQDLPINESYYLQYSVITTNNMLVRSPKYRIMQKNSIDPELQATLSADVKFEEGYVELTLQGKKDELDREIPATGTYIVVRSCEDEDFKTWHEILKFALYGQKPTTWIWNDFTVEQGKKYKYAIQQYNEYGIFSNRIESKIVYADFEDMFLFDGEKQLKVKFNPKVSSFKNTILESKMDTIGSKHPYIFRNGTVKYKEFPVAGLISYYMDEQKLFSQLEIEEYTINLTGSNIANERKFKLEVLDWLTNGKPKLFKSPNEGNYIVRLLNTSMSPIDSVGRMLHSFTSTAYEICDNTYDNLKKYGFIKIIDPTKKQLRFKSIDLKTIDVPTANFIDDNIVAVSIKCEDMLPGDKIYIDDGVKRKNISAKSQVYETGFVVTIGATGSYYLEPDEFTQIYSISFLEKNTDVYSPKQLHQGTLTYGFYSRQLNQFDNVVNLQIVDNPSHQFIGENKEIIGEITDIKQNVQMLYTAHFMLKEIEGNYIYKEDTKVFKTVAGAEVKLLPNPYVLYRICDENGNLIYYYDGKQLYSPDEYSSHYIINGVDMDLAEYSEFTISNFPEINSLYLGLGVMAEISYQSQIIEYKVESTDSRVKAAKAKWLEVYNKLKESIWIKESIVGDQEAGILDWEQSFIEIDDKGQEIENKEAFKQFAEEQETNIKIYSQKERDLYQAYINEIQRALRELEEQEHGME